MCGIVGIISGSAHTSIAACTAALAHRGPDDSGILHEPPVAMGHRRLSIIEVSSLGHQPMFSNDGRFAIVFNGEIYNHADIRRLIGDRYVFRSKSDTETIVGGFATLGCKLFELLNGIFAFILFDRIAGKLFIVRDQLGVKPLYYYSQGREFFVASEIKALLRIPGWDRAIDCEALVDYLRYLYSPGDATPFLKVRKFPAGHYAELTVENPADCKFVSYYRITYNGVYDIKSETDAVDVLDEALGRAVQRQLMADVPVGFFLSGGLDSSMIVAKARKMLGNTIDCFTINAHATNKGAEGFVDDLAYARTVAAHLGTNLHEVSGKIEVIRDFESMVWNLDEPLSDVAPLHVMNISSAARQLGYKVLLGGTGADDLFSGYRRHQVLRYEGLIRASPGCLLKALEVAGSHLPVSVPAFRRIKRLTSDLSESPVRRMAGYFGWLPLSQAINLFTDEVRSSIANYDPAERFLRASNENPLEKDLLNKMLFWDQKYFLPDHNLIYTDKMSMSQGVEVRVPYLDQDLVGLSTRIHPSLKMRKGVTKYLLRRLAERYLPNSVIYRSKVGFGSPLRTWISAGYLEPLIARYLNPQVLHSRGLFDSKVVGKLLEDSKRHRYDASYTIWGLIAIESWMQQFVDLEPRHL